MKNIPNLFLIGSPKTGTTALTKNITQHHEIYVPENSEERYFDHITFYDQPDTYDISEEDYLECYSNAGEYKYYLDDCALSMYNKKSIENILELSPDAKFIIILRDPVEASLSMHRQRLTYVDKKMREVSDDFMECWNLLEKRKKGEGYPKGCRNKFLFRYDLLYSYEKYLPYLQKKLGDKLFIGFYDEYKEKPDQFFEKLFDFLEIEKIQIKSKKINESLVVQDSMVLDILESFQTYTLPLRKKIGLSGLKSLKTKVLKLYQKKNGKVNVDAKVYDFFQPTYKYLAELKDALKD